MIRRCDGTDPNLHDITGQACRCGKSFDDVGHSTVWPHNPLAAPPSSSPGVVPFDLAAGEPFCPECGRHKATRLFYPAWTPLRNPLRGRAAVQAPAPVLTGCKTCDEVITRHRCHGRPRLEDMDDGQSWTCPCGTTWTAEVEPVVELREDRAWHATRPGSEEAATPSG